MVLKFLVSNFLSQGSFILLKFIKNPNELLFCELYLLTLTILKIKTDVQVFHIRVLFCLLILLFIE